MFNNKTKISIFIVSLFLVTLFAFIYLINYYKDTRIETILNNHTYKIKTFYNMLAYNQTKKADISFEETITNKPLVSILKEANKAYQSNDKESLDRARKQAYTILEEKYKLYKKVGILQYHFVFPDNRVFLRMHKPSKFGDDLSSVRKDFVKANKNLQIIRGFAQGRTAHAFRNVYPIIDENQTHLGAVEVSFSSELLQNYLTQVSKIHTHFLVRKDIFKSHTWKRDDLILKYLQSSEHPNYMITMTADHTIFKCIDENKHRVATNKEKILKSINDGREFSVYSKFQDRINVSSFIPVLHNISNEPVAYIVSYVNEPLILETLFVANIMYVVAFVFLFVLAMFIYFLLHQKQLLHKTVKNKTFELDTLNKNLQKQVDEQIAALRELDRQIAENSKMAAIGDMIGNIAHQWRQPLSVISTGSTGVLMYLEEGILTDEFLKKEMDMINDNAQYLSKTIDTFREFIKSNKTKVDTTIQKMIETSLHLVRSNLEAHFIQIKQDIQNNPIKLYTVDSEFEQVIINILNNAKDVLIENKIEDPWVKVSLHTKSEDLAIITIEDNGGGIPLDIISRIFEPYFTTKHKSRGTGLGLHMSFRIVTESLEGKIYAKNSQNGALFVIEIPLDMKKNDRSESKDEYL